MENILNSIDKANNQLIKDRTKEEEKIKEWQKEQNKLEDLKDHGLKLKKLQVLFQKAAEATQKQLEIHINGLVSSALSAVWDDPYEFSMEFVQRRGKTEADLWLIKDDLKLKPLDESGGGVADIVSLALRMAFWSLTKETRPLLIFDEPLKFVNDMSRTLHKKAASMFKMLSEKLNLQILMISHINEFINIADKRINIKKINGKSVIKEE